jgi:hypothetical protein
MPYLRRTGAVPWLSRAIGILSGRKFPERPSFAGAYRYGLFAATYSYSIVASSDTFSTLSEMRGGISVYPLACP